MSYSVNVNRNTLSKVINLIDFALINNSINRIKSGTYDNKVLKKTLLASLYEFSGKIHLNRRSASRLHSLIQMYLLMQLKEENEINEFKSLFIELSKKLNKEEPLLLQYLIK